MFLENQIGRVSLPLLSEPYSASGLTFALCLTKVLNADLRVDSIFRRSYVNQFLALQDEKTDASKGFQSWNEVLELIHDAEDRYVLRGEGSWLRRNMRRDDVAAVLKDLTELIPEEYGLGVLRGGLSMLFTVSPQSLITENPKLSDRILLS